jgi:hypothetical protein
MMRRIRTVTLSAAIMLACAAAAAEETTGTKRLMKETTEAVLAAREATAEKREELRFQVMKRLEGMDHEMEDLKAKARDGGVRMRERYDEELKQLGARRETFAKRFDELTTSSKLAWQDVKVGVEDAWEDLDKAFRKAKDRFK